MKEDVKNQKDAPLAVNLQRWVRRLAYIPPEFYALAYCAGIWYFTGKLSPDMALGMTVVAMATTFFRKL